MQIHRSNQGEDETKVDVSGSLEAQLSAKLLIREAISKPPKPKKTGLLMFCSIIFQAS